MNEVATKKLLDVTVVTPTFNRAKLVERALDSVRNQTRRVSEIIVVDDGSTDGTPDVARRWGERHQQPVRVAIMERNGGPAAARNRGIQLAETSYVAFLDSDDEHLPSTLQVLCAALDANPDAVLSFGDATVVTPSGREVRGLFAPRINLAVAASMVNGGLYRLNDAVDTLLAASILPTSATCFRRADALAVGGMPEQFRSGEDWLFFLRMTQRGRFVFTTEDLALHHRHENNLTGPRAGEFIAREKLAGFVALESGTAGCALNSAQRARVRKMLLEQQAHWRYHLSRMGLSAFLNAVGSLEGGKARQIAGAPRDALRALCVSLGLLR